MRLKIGTVAAMLAGALVMAGPANGAIREVPQDFPTIQDAEDAANPGDTIEISKKRNLENVDVNVANLKIVGVKPGVVVDGYINGVGNGQQFDILANGVRLKNLEIRNGDGVDCNSSNGCVAEKLRWTGEGETDCFYADGDRAKVLKSSMRSCGSAGIRIPGDDAKIQGNTIRRTDDGCIEGTGDDALIANNRLFLCEDDDAIYVAADDAVVKGNRVNGANGSIVEISGNNAQILQNRGSNATAVCYFVSGDRAKVRNNTGSSCQDGGVYADGENLKITGNRISGVNGYGYELSCFGSCGGVEVSENKISNAYDDDTGMQVEVSNGSGSALIARNVITNASEYGIDLGSTDDALVVGNTVRGSASEGEEAFTWSGDENVLRNNRAIDNGGDGFRITAGGSDNLLEGNLAKLNSGDGFQFNGTANEFIENTATANRADGIENDGVDTILRRNKASGNHRDCANDGSIDVKVKNKCADGSNFNLPGTASRVKHRR